MSWATPITLVGNNITLIPLSIDHTEGLIKAASDGELWHIWYADIPSPDTMQMEINRKIESQKQGKILPFTVVNIDTKQIIGMTTYYNIDSKTKRIDIGSTWYSKSHQKTMANTEAKFLLLNHAFETLKCVAVELRISIFNQESKKAAERLGAKYMGTLRNHRLLKNGILTDSYIYSIIDSEWPTIKTHLTWKLMNRQINIK